MADLMTGARISAVFIIISNLKKKMEENGILIAWHCEHSGSMPLAKLLLNGVSFERMTKQIFEELLQLLDPIPNIVKYKLTCSLQ